MRNSEIKWHRGHDADDDHPEPGEWYAEVRGETIARVSVRHGTPTGYWGRYRGHVYGRSVHVTTLAEFRQQVTDAHAARITGSAS